jgi:hypothetical protein
MQVINHRPILPTFALDSSPIHRCLIYWRKSARTTRKGSGEIS